MRIFKRLRQWFCGHRYRFWIYQKQAALGGEPVDRRTCRCCGYIQARPNDKKAALISNMKKMSLNFQLLSIQLDAIRKQMESPHPYGGIIAVTQSMAEFHAKNRVTKRKSCSPWVGKIPKASNKPIRREELIVINGNEGDAVAEKLHKFLDGQEGVKGVIY